MDKVSQDCLTLMNDLLTIHSDLQEIHLRNSDFSCFTDSSFFKQIIVWFFLIILLIYLFLPVLGLQCCADLSLVVVSKGYSLGAVHRLLIAVASLVKHWL